MSRIILPALLLPLILIVVKSISIEDSRPQLKQGRVNIVNPKYKVASFTETLPLFLLHLLKHKHTYAKLEKITTMSPVADCICVPYYLCDNNQTIITDGMGVIDVRYRRCTGDLEVCCYPPNNVSMAPVITPTVPPTTQTTPTTPPTTPTTPPTTPTTPPTTPTTPPTTPTTPTTPSTTSTTTPSPPPVIFPTAVPTLPPSIPNGFYCVCVSASQCDPSLIVGLSGEGQINPRQQLGLCPSADQVCCRAPLAGVQYPPIVLPTTGLPQICFQCGNTIQCTNGIGFSDGTGIINPRLTYSNIGTCGVPAPTCCQGSNVVGNTAIINGLQLKNPGTPQACYCVKTWSCTEGNAVSLDGLGIIDPRFTSCSSADEVCCRPSGIDVQLLREDKNGQGVFIMNPGGELAPQIACGMQNETFAPENPFPVDSGKTYFGEFPWMVALLRKQANAQYEFQCGGSLISNKAVLTAAHCVTNRDNSNLVARLGQWDLESTDEDEPFVEVSVKAIISHPLYYAGGLFHDVAVLILNEPTTYDINISPICLPAQGMIFSAGSRCFGTGWGRNSFDGIYQAELRKVELPIVDRTECQTRLRNTRLGQTFQLHGSFICAGGEPNRDTCRGDGGGPLTCVTSTGQFIQAGIVSWGIGCGMSNIPAVYASVAQHRQWIDQQLAVYGA